VPPGTLKKARKKTSTGGTHADEKKNARTYTNKKHFKGENRFRSGFKKKKGRQLAEGGKEGN